MPYELIGKNGNEFHANIQGMSIIQLMLGSGGLDIVDWDARATEPPISQCEAARFRSKDPTKIAGTKLMYNDFDRMEHEECLIIQEAFKKKWIPAEEKDKELADFLNSLDDKPVQRVASEDTDRPKLVPYIYSTDDIKRKREKFIAFIDQCVIDGDGFLVY